LISNEGFSVVAPIRTMVPASTNGRKASCCALLKRRLGAGHDVANLLDAGHHGAERDEARLRAFGNQPGQRRLACARRSPEDQRLQDVSLDEIAQRGARAKHRVLADDLVEGARPHPLGQGRVRIGRRGGGVVVEERACHGRERPGNTTARRLDGTTGPCLFKTSRRRVVVP
jgi:hypothetical protein